MSNYMSPYLAPSTKGQETFWADKVFGGWMAHRDDPTGDVVGMHKDIKDIAKRLERLEVIEAKAVSPLLGGPPVMTEREARIWNGICKGNAYSK